MNIERDLYLGVDPGNSGGLAIVDRCGIVVDVSKMPETEADIVEYLREFAPRVRMACIESVHSFPGQGVASSFVFGMSYGALRMGLVAIGIPFEAASPQKWQKVMTIPVVDKKEKKKATKARAQALFPGRKLSHATADALLLAEYCRRSHALPAASSSVVNFDSLINPQISYTT